MTPDAATNLLNNVPCGIFSFTEQGIITYVNQQLLKQLDYTAAELTGQQAEKILTLSSRIFYQTHFSPLLKLQGEVNEVFLTLQSKNKTSVPVLVNASQTKDDSGGVVNVCACILVQQRKKYEDEILLAKKTAEEALNKNELLKKAQHQLEMSRQEVDKQMTQLMHTNNELLQLNDIVSHDLQEPVRKISMYADILKGSEKIGADKKTRSSIDIIAKSSDRIRKVLQSLQEYMSILTKEIKKVPVDLNVLIEDRLKILKDERPELQFNLIWNKLPEIEGDLPQLQTLFLELLNNCVEFRKPGRDLVIQITASTIEENVYNYTEGKYKYAEFATITIEDNGMGFNPAYKDLIFKILKRLDYTRSGLGFGLAICKRIAENHLGYITAAGEEDKGAKFTVFLPVARDTFE